MQVQENRGHNQQASKTGEGRERLVQGQDSGESRDKKR